MKNPPREEIVTELISFPLLKYRRPHKNLSIVGSLPEKSLPADNLITGKNSSRPGGRRAGRIFAGELLTRGDFSGGWSYDGTPALDRHSRSACALTKDTGGRRSCSGWQRDIHIHQRRWSHSAVWTTLLSVEPYSQSRDGVDHSCVDDGFCSSSQTDLRHVKSSYCEARLLSCT